jgi:hypothetical protein
VASGNVGGLCRAGPAIPDRPEKARYLGFEQLAIRIPRKPYPIG